MLYNNNPLMNTVYLKNIESSVKRIGKGLLNYVECRKKESLNNSEKDKYKQSMLEDIAYLKKQAEYLETQLNILFEE